MFADIEQQIIDRLADYLAANYPTAKVHVAPIRDLERAPELRNLAPACWVVYDGYTVGEVIPPGQVQRIRNEWFVVVAAKSAKGAGKVDAAREQASEIAEKVLEALLGYHLGKGRYLQLGDAPGPEYDAGYCHVPLAFTNPATFKGQP
jgi:phage gp37-like protein